MKVFVFAASFIVLLTCPLSHSQEAPPATTADSTLESVEPSTLDTDSSGSAYPFIGLDPCRGETYEGRCAGKTLVWCEDRQVKTANCKRACGWDSTNCFYNCL